ncbi:MAG: hypothetical protein RI897_1843 [Verrucomicrobiota bacterium]|jgi:outer membrane receptor protein involved in Fe transport
MFYRAERKGQVLAGQPQPEGVVVGLRACLQGKALGLFVAVAFLAGRFAPELRAQAVPPGDVGRIVGVVRNGWDNVPLGSVVVVVRGTTLAVKTDGQGRYVVEAVPPGDYSISFSKSGFARLTVTDVRVGAGQISTVEVPMKPEFYEMEEYEVTAEELGDQMEQIYFERQESATFMDALGSDQFKNLAVSDAADVLGKVTGATVADGKYAVVRGLADRYTFTTMNGMDLPSADPDRKAFQLDLFPASFIEKVDVRKTFTPDMGGGFAGGAIDIVTKSFPEEFLYDVRLSTAYNTQSSLNDDFYVTDRGSMDWLGFDDGTRALPGVAEASSPSGTPILPPEVKHSFESSQFAPTTSKSPLDSGFSMTFGDTQEVFGKKLGYLAGVNYKNEFRYYDDGFVRSYEGRGDTVAIDKTDRRGTADYQWGALANLSLEMSENHQFFLNMLYIRSAQDEARRLQGQDGDVTDPAEGTYTDQSILAWTERSLTYFQLGGAHEFPEMNEVEVDWGAGVSTTSQDQPDYRIFQFYADPQNNFYSPEISSAQPTSPTRYWRELTENNANLRGDVTIPVSSYNEGENFLKTGAAYSESKRDYMQRGFSVVRGRNGHPFYNTGDPNSWVAEENLDFINYRNFPVNLEYAGYQYIQAFYLMGEYSTTDWLRFIGGGRYEHTDLSINARNLTRNQDLPPGEILQDDILPSLTAVVQLRPDLDLRAAWSQTVVRPTYREIADVPIYDVTQNRTYTGNPNLEVSESQNVDLRVSYYPRAGEIISASLFAKRINQPIEQASITTDNSRITYENFEQADVWGVEAEVRGRLDRIWEPLDEWSVGVNGAYISSEVPLNDQQRINRQGYGDFSTTRPLYNQPTYVLNADLSWDHQLSGTTVTLSGGVVGESLVLVGLAKPDEYVQSAPQLNFFVQQRLGRGWDLRFTAKNLLDPAYEVAQTWPEAGKQTLQSYTRGMTFGLSVGYTY